MCANRGGPVNPSHVNVQLNVVPSSLSFARKVPWAPLALGGTSLKVDNRVKNRTPSSLFWARTFSVARLAAMPTTVSSSKAATNGLYFMCFIGFLLQEGCLWELAIDPGVFPLSFERPSGPRDSARRAAGSIPRSPSIFKLHSPSSLSQRLSSRP